MKKTNRKYATNSKSAQTAVPKVETLKFRKKKKSKKEGRSLNRNEKSWSLKCVVGPKQEERHYWYKEEKSLPAFCFRVRRALLQ
jgi:hypothetical protein